MKTWIRFCAVIFAAPFFVYFIFISDRANVRAQTGDLLTQISQYKTWTKLTDEPIKFAISESFGAS